MIVGLKSSIRETSLKKFSYLRLALLQVWCTLTDLVEFYLFVSQVDQRLATHGPWTNRPKILLVIHGGLCLCLKHIPALQDFLKSSGSGTGSTHPRDYNRGAT
jgi:hypothetical protein